MRDANARWSAIAPLVDQSPPPTDRLIDLALEAASRARQVDLSAVTARIASAEARRWVRQWPGEHYRFLAGLVGALEPSLVVEVGTLTGFSALTFATAVPPPSRVVTFDIVGWQDFPDTCLRDSDFEGSLEQRLADLSGAECFAQHRDLLSAADIIFMDGPKDGRFEPAFIELLLGVPKTGAVLVFDDIRLIPLLQPWRDLPLPKLDVTSFSHWSGTGLVDVVDGRFVTSS